MGLFMNDSNDIKQKVLDEFGRYEDYLIVKKYNKPAVGLIKFLVYKFGWLMDSNRQFILYFNEKGVYEKEISDTLNGKFSLMPWNEVELISVEDKGDKGLIFLTHIQKEYNYEVMYANTKYLRGNRERFINLKNNNFNKL